MPGPDKTIRKRLKSLELHLQEQNPILVSAVDGFRQLSRVGYSMGLLGKHESYATQIPWWPLISVLGTFSAGKSTFVNQYLSYPLQDTGNQAVDDKFTVICFTGEGEVRTLPGLALDADPRFPFYQTSAELDRVESGQGRRIDAYLQLKTCPSEKLRGLIFIDSPGFAPKHPCHLAQLVHEVRLGVQPPRRVDHDDTGAPGLRGMVRVVGNRGRIRAALSGHDVDADTLGPCLKLIGGGGPESVGGTEEHGTLGSVQLLSELGDGGGLAAPVRSEKPVDLAARHLHREVVHHHVAVK